MTILQHVIIGILWIEIIGVSLFLAACAVGVGLWSWTRWAERRHCGT